MSPGFDTDFREFAWEYSGRFLSIVPGEEQTQEPYLGLFASLIASEQLNLPSRAKKASHDRRHAV
jgi:hypothetical protein